MKLFESDEELCDKTIGNYLLIKLRAQKILPKAIRNEILKEGAANFSQKLSDYWDSTRCLYFKHNARYAIDIMQCLLNMHVYKRTHAHPHSIDVNKYKQTMLQ